MIPGPIVVETEIFNIYLPFTALGFVLIISDTKDLIFSINLYILFFQRLISPS